MEEIDLVGVGRGSMSLEELVQLKIKECTSLEELTLLLEHLIKYNSIDENGRLYSIRALVDSVNGMKIEIFSNEHPPPHFHINSKGIRAVFSLENGQLLKGKIGGREQKLIEWWYNGSRSKLIDFWNKSRPSNCSVGKYK